MRDLSATGPYCGDATCGANENCTSCSADCGVCPPPPGDVYIYSDENHDGSNITVSASAENTTGGHVELEVTVTKEADGSILGTQSSSGSGSTVLTLDAPYTATENDVATLDGGTALVVLVLGRAVIGGILKSIFKRTSIKVGVSTLWYEISGQSSDSAGGWCDYVQITPVPSTVHQACERIASLRKASSSSNALSNSCLGTSPG